ncbi:alpha-galactosidase, partial [Escherichia coli]
MFKKLGYFVTESSEHFAEYTPWFIKPGREDLIERYKVPLDEYPKRCVEQLANWHKELEEYKKASRIDIKPSREYASTIMNAIWTGEPSVIYGNVRNDGLIDNLPQGCCVEVACLVDANGIQPTKVGTLPSHLAALMQTNINVQTLLTEAILTENRDRVYHAAMMDPHTAAVLGIDEIYALVDDLIAAHGDWLPGWLHR